MSQKLSISKVWRFDNIVISNGAGVLNCRPFNIESNDIPLPPMKQRRKRTNKISMEKYGSDIIFDTRKLLLEVIQKDEYNWTTPNLPIPPQYITKTPFNMPSLWRKVLLTLKQFNL